MANPGGTITLKGSTAIVTEFFSYAVHSILYQRGIYPEDHFNRVKKYGLSLLICKDPRVNDYMQQVFNHISDWLLGGTLQKLVMVIASVATKEVQERWVFNVELETAKPDGEDPPKVEKTDKEIMGEIQAIIRQITASVTFLPLLEDSCTFDLLAYTARDLAVPSSWEESDARLIANAQHVQLRSLNTTVHSIGASVAYKVDA